MLRFLLASIVSCPVLAQGFSVVEIASLSATPTETYSTPLFPIRAALEASGCPNCTVWVTQSLTVSFTIFSTINGNLSIPATTTTTTTITTTVKDQTDTSTTTSAPFTWDLSGYDFSSTTTTQRLQSTTVNSTVGPSSTATAVADALEASSTDETDDETEAMNTEDSDTNPEASNQYLEEEEDEAGEDDERFVSGDRAERFTLRVCEEENLIVCLDDNSYERCSKIMDDGDHPLVWTHHDLPDDQLCSQGKLHRSMTNGRQWRA